MSSSNVAGCNALRLPSSRWVNSSIRLLRFKGPGCTLIIIIIVIMVIVTIIITTIILIIIITLSSS